jgi:serine/threonine protein kinase
MEPPKEHILPANIKLDKELGKGSFGNVYLGTYGKSKDPVAIKVIQKSKYKKPVLSIKVKRELIPFNILECENKNIICVRDVYENDNSVYIISDYIEGKTLWKYDWSDDDELIIRISIFKQLVDALIFMHNKQVYHRDIKPHNIILRNDHIPVYIDFDNACYIGEKNISCKGHPGTPNFQPPELFERREQIDWDKVDIYSLGATMFYMFNNNKTPYENRILESTPEVPGKFKALVQLELDVKNGPPRFSDSGSGIIDDIIDRMLRRDPQARPSLESIKYELDESFI